MTGHDQPGLPDAGFPGHEDRGGCALGGLLDRLRQADVIKKKNATDIVRAVDAVSLLHTDRPDAFCIVSSDADFTPLVMHLRERERGGLWLR